jgi:Ca-activated chloride channel homolog
MSSDLSIECKLARDYSMENVGDALSYLLVKLAANSAVQTVTLPLNLGLVIDVSRSMKGEKISFACQAAKLLVSALRNEDWVSVITFSDDAKVVAPATSAYNRASVLSLIEGIKTDNGTRMFLGMEAGSREMLKVGFANKINQMIILTDGETEGDDRCRNIAGEHSYSPVTGGGKQANHMLISTLGVGKKYNENLLSQIADATLGRFYHLNTPEQIIGILQKEVEDASSAVISEVSLSLSLAQGVKIESIDRIFPTSVRLQPRNEAGGKILAVDIGALRKDEPTIVGIQMKLPSRSAGRAQIAQISVNYNIPGLQIEDNVENRDVFVEYTGDPGLCSRIDREVISYFNQISTQKLVDQAITETKKGNIAGATKSLAQAQEITQRLGNLPLSETIKTVKQELTQEGTISEEGLKTIKAGSRFTVKLDEKQTKRI